jgi:hypothetical protein
VSADTSGRSHPATTGYCWGYTLVQRHWLCVQHFLLSCNASPPDCPHPTDLWLDLLDLFSCDTAAAEWVSQALHVDFVTPRMSVTFACRDSWTLSASLPLVPAPSLLPCARFWPAMSFWLGLLLLMRTCLLLNRVMVFPLRVSVDCNSC